MPVILERSIHDCHLAIWKITETLDEFREILGLMPEQESILASFKNDNRKLEWVCSRALVKHLIPTLKAVNIFYDQHGKPQLESNNHPDFDISISHSHSHVAVIVGKNSVVGIDLETIRDRIVNISKRFINESEMAALNEKHAIEQMHVLWGAKEVIYKIYSVGDLSFHNEIFIDKFNYAETGALKGYLLKDNFAKRFDLNYERVNDLMLVYCCGE